MQLIASAREKRAVKREQRSDKTEVLHVGFL